MFQELLTSFGAIEEPRQVGKVDHLLIDVLAITVCAVLAHAETFEDIAHYGKHKENWLRQFLELPNGIPSHDTFRRVFLLGEAIPIVLIQIFLRLIFLFFVVWL